MLPLFWGDDIMLTNDQSGYESFIRFNQACGLKWAMAKSLSVLFNNNSSAASAPHWKDSFVLIIARWAVRAAFRSLSTELKKGRDTFIAELGYKKE